MNLFLDYDKIAVLELNSEYANPFQGSYGVGIVNTGRFSGPNNVPIVSIDIK